MIYLKGNKDIPYNDDNVFVEPVDDIKELDYYVDLLGINNCVIYENKKTYTLVTKPEKLTEHYKRFMKKEEEDV